MSERARPRVGWIIAALTVYVLLAAGVVALMFHVRDGVLAPAAEAESQQGWRRWQADVEKQNREGPVRRAVPRSDEPPAVVLMRDHFAAVTLSAVVFVLILFSVIAFAIRAVFSPPSNSLVPQDES